MTFRNAVVSSSLHCFAVVVVIRCHVFRGISVKMVETASSTTASIEELKQQMNILYVTISLTQLFAKLSILIYLFIYLFFAVAIYHF